MVDQDITTGLHGLLVRAERLLERLEAMVPPRPGEPDWEGGRAFRWHHAGNGGRLEVIDHPHRLPADSLRGVERQKTLLGRNTRQFVAGLPANNALLWGSRGTGKSSLVKAMLHAYGDRGLRLIEVNPRDLTDLPAIIARLAGRPERFVLFCDDLSFEADDPGYKTLKAILDGSLSAPPDNLLIYATSNRRHLLPEYMTDNADTRMVDGELHHGEAVEEKISLSERFGLWIPFHPFNQDTYLDIVRNWLNHFGIDTTDQDTFREQALRYALERGSRSGRVAWQFARDYAGREGLGE